MARWCSFHLIVGWVVRGGRGKPRRPTMERCSIRKVSVKSHHFPPGAGWSGADGAPPPDRDRGAADEPGQGGRAVRNHRKSAWRIGSQGVESRTVWIPS